MNEYFPEPISSEANVKVELKLSNYATKTDLKNTTGVDISSFAKKSDLASLKSKVDKLDVNKLVPVPVDLSKLSALVKNYVVKKDVYNTKIKNIEDKIADITNLATNSSINLNDIAILNSQGSDFRCIISLISKNEAINLLQNADLTEKSGTLKRKWKIIH